MSKRKYYENKENIETTDDTIKDEINEQPKSDNKIKDLTEKDTVHKTIKIKYIDYETNKEIDKKVNIREKTLKNLQSAIESKSFEIVKFYVHTEVKSSFISTKIENIIKLEILN